MNPNASPESLDSPSTHRTRDTPTFAAVLAGADRCVVCGMCVPQCPTYAVQRVEGDSPRGRIMLMKGLAQGRLDPRSPRLHEHLEGCLGCRSCEAICPAGVRFGELIDHSRQILLKHPVRRSQHRLDTVLAPLRRRALRRPWLRRAGALAARAAVASGLPRLLPPSTWLGRLLRHVAPSLVPAPAPQPVTDATQADVWLFTGCMDAFFTGPDIRAALELLERLGVRVAIPPGQVCCGALDQHLGRLDDAAYLRASNLRAFTGAQPVLALDSGCEAQLREYSAERWQERVTSLTGFLARLPVENGRWRSDPVRVALHLPCTLRNVNRETENIRRVLQRLPGVELTALAPPRNCCGAGGTAMLTQPKMADRLGEETLQALQALAPDVIVSPNVGCSVHLRALLADAGPPIVAPAQFLNERLARSA